ncbi:MAG: aminoacyl-tRNA hydrolase [Cyanobacteria bacterium SW_9_44_58]|nr:MAG: aminoacyl-tRNA hydrolase [Cyanobacteria bacterium SW_9_44_58]
MSEIKLIVGLGNPGKKYEQTRHNIGFDAVDRLAKDWQLNWRKDTRFKGYYCEGAVPTIGKVHLLKPLTYMNHSGQAIRAVCDWYKFSPESVLIIYDDLDLPVGKLRLRLSGSAGGHNGMKSIISHLGTENFPRLRIGIKNTEMNKDTVSHVLGKFSPEEQPYIKDTLNLVPKVIDLSLHEGLEKAMSLYN